MKELDPVIAQLLEGLKQMNLTPLHQLQPEQAREGMKLMMPDVAPTQIYAVEERLCDVGDHPFALRVYRPSNESSLPALVLYHGGGWVVCDLDTHDEVCRQIASKAQCVVVSVDYRLAPEHKFPAAVDDAYSALRWTASRAAELGVDASRIAVGGDSAGGNLAAAISIKAREENGPPICHQSLWYPVTNISELTTSSYGEFAEGYRLEKAGMQWFKDHYIDAEKDAKSIYASPLLAEDLSGLPSAYVMTAGFDVLHDEGRDYAQKMKSHGNDVVYECFDSLIHGFMNMGAIAPSAQSAIDKVATQLRCAFEV